MNSKAQIPTLLTFLIALIFSVITLSAFLMFSGGFANSSSEFSSIVSDIEFNQQYVTEQAKLIAKETISSNQPNLEQTFQEIAENKNLNFAEAGNFFTQIKNNANLEFKKTGETFILKINNLTVQAEKEGNKIIRPFNVCTEFDLQGNFLNNC
jgi:glucan biosynthesis protein